MNTKSLQKFLAKSRIDKIKDDEKFMTEEYEAVQEYCEKCRFIMSQNDLEEIGARGLIDSFAIWKQSYAEELWHKFEDVPMDPETGCIGEPFLKFPAGTEREEIWGWFEKTMMSRCMAWPAEIREM